MAEQEETKPKKMPKGGRKGGARFPQLDLEKALSYSKKLVSKTHTGALPENVILPGVFGRLDGTGRVRASALKQYGLLEGPITAYKATALAKAIDAAPPEEINALTQQAFAKPKIFHKLIETYQNDVVSKAKIEQRVRGLEVHPDLAGKCTDIFVSSAIKSGLGVSEGDGIRLKSLSSSAPVPSIGGSDNDDEEGHDEELEPPSGEENSQQQAEEKKTELKAARENNAEDTKSRTSSLTNTHLQLTVNLNVDSSSDPEKLEKQLKLLKRFGALG